MKRVLLATLILLITSVISVTSSASRINPDIVVLTNMADVVVVGECIFIGERKDVEVTDGIRRDVVDYGLKVVEVVKNEIGEGVEAEKEFSFTTFAPVRLENGKKYMLFLGRYSYGIWRFIADDAGLFEVGRDVDGVETVVNKRDNANLFRGVSAEETDKKASSLGLKRLTDREKSVMQRTKGPVGRQELVDVVKRLEEIRQKGGER